MTVTPGATWPPTALPGSAVGWASGTAQQTYKLGLTAEELADIGHTINPAETGVAGTPGSFTGGIAPPTVAALIAGQPQAVASSTGAVSWTSGQYVKTLDGGVAHWNGTAWVAGAKP